ncbi:folylpolyglutamate synthase/dihydrofolate synthase family protein [Neobittarella massiliensis]|uniref:bifunctional folylpolyglutamate synthase/dihydrofolate synthase n=1 Tax=Neobittarella massiliensis (ex Bilen et al. 2018) TaxID=2041842 RepID=UPI000CF74613|nr:folylpolyglutamate synthase/dihydrofolate synthase family protein [Neobittarella massiliensis]
MLDWRQAEAYVQGRDRFVKKPGLARMRQLMHRLGDPQDRLRCIHIAGTNGKGSTTVMTAGILQAAGYRVGMNISPYVLEFRERFQVNGQMISRQELAQLVTEIKRVCDEMEAAGDYVTAFEITTAIAFCWFARQDLDVVCLEVGLGGRFDATNVIREPLCCAITSISLDHTKILGDTVEQIAAEKCGILKPGRPVVCYPDQPVGALQVICAQAAAQDCPLVLPDMADIQVHKSDLLGNDIAYRGQQLRIPFGGAHQIKNAAVVLAVIEQLRQQGFEIPPTAVQQGLAAARFPARLEVLGQKPLVVLDGAHNLSGAQALCRAVEAAQLPPGGRRIAVMGMLNDKDAAGIAALAGPLFDEILLVDIHNSRAVNSEQLAAIFAGHCRQVSSWHQLDRAVQAAFERSGADDLLVFCGSLYLASEVRGLLVARQKK